MGNYKSLIVNISYQKNNDGFNNSPSNLIRKRKYQEKTTKNIRLIGLAFGVLTGLLVSFGTVFYVIERSEKYNNIKIIKADKVPFKLPPTDPGGLTVDNKEQALVRASKTKKNNGGHAAKACIELIKSFNLL